MKGHTAVLAVLGALALAAPAAAQECEGVRADGASKLIVQVNGVRAARGEVAITVYGDDKRKFLARGGKLARVRVPAAPTVKVCFWLPSKTYAIAVYHDADGDRDFDRNMVGMPAEGFGFSNNPETRMGLPAMGKVRFRLPAGESTTSIQMRYVR